MSGATRLGGRTVEVSRPDKVLFPGDGITKADLAGYYARIAGTMLPHVRGRPLVLERYPDGIEAEGFYQKDVPDSFPDWVERVEVETGEREIAQVVVREQPATLVFLADQGCITPHAWLSRADALDRPDRLVLDLDPSDGELEGVRRAARELRSILEAIGLAPHLMTTGSRGFHVVAPIEPDASFDDARALVRDAALLLARRHPGAYTVEPRKQKRRGRLFLDYLRNAYGQTAVAPYAVRARPGAPVATPVDWSELAALEPGAYTIRNLFRRLGQKDDPWQGIDDRRGSLAAAREALDELLARDDEGD